MTFRQEEKVHDLVSDYEEDDDFEDGDEEDGICVVCLKEINVTEAAYELALLGKDGCVCRRFSHDTT